MTTEKKGPGRTSGMEKAVDHFGETFKCLVELRIRAALAAALAEISLVPHPWPKPVFQRLARGIAKAVSLYLQTNALGASLASNQEPKQPGSLGSMILITLNYERVRDSWVDGNQALATGHKAKVVNIVVPAKLVKPWSRVDVGNMEISIYLNNDIPEELSNLLKYDLRSQLVDGGLALGPVFFKPRANWKTQPSSTTTDALWDVRARMSIFVALFLNRYTDKFIYPDPFMVFFLRPCGLGRANSQGIKTHVRSGFLGYSYLIDDGQRQHLTENLPDINPRDLDGDMALPFPLGVCGSVFLQGSDSEPFLSDEVINTYEKENVGISTIERSMLKDRVLLELPVHVADIDALSPDGPELILSIAIPLNRSKSEEPKNDVGPVTPLDLKSDVAQETNPKRIENMSRSPYPGTFKPGEFQILREVSRRLINEFVRTPAVPAPNDVLLSKSSAMASIVNDAQVLARSKRPILILGPAGSGKTTLATHIHGISPRNEKKFKVVSGASLSKDLARSEIFGYMKGAFTGAMGNRPGILEDANDGTLFIDDFEVLPPDVQAMLLSVMEGGEYCRVGETTGNYRTVDVKFILATNASTNDLIANGMRRDFLTRFAGSVTMPPLYRRSEDIPDLVRHFIEVCVTEQYLMDQESKISVSSEVIEMFQNNDWSDGEVRALRYTVEMACTKLLSESKDAQPKPNLILSPQHVSWALDVRLPHTRFAPQDTHTALAQGEGEINANAAALGAGFGYPTVSRALFEFNSAISNIRSFCEQSINAKDHSIALTTSATSACEACLLALAPEAEIILYTNFAHPNVVNAIKSVSRIISKLRGKELISTMVPLGHLVTESVDATSLAASISEELLTTAKQQRAIVVLEHVTYKGLRIPIDAICAAFEDRPSQLLIDAAQASGVWQPRNPLTAHVFGCFHKFIGAPAGTGFLALRDRKELLLPYSIGHTILENTEDFPTTDIRKWELTSLAINRLTERFSDPTKTEREVKRFMESLRNHLRPLTSTLDEVVDPELHSHILTVELDSPRHAQRVVEELASHNVRVQQLHNRVRVSMGSQSRLADAQRIGSFLRYAAQSTKSHT